MNYGDLVRIEKLWRTARDYWDSEKAYRYLSQVSAYGIDGILSTERAANKELQRREKLMEELDKAIEDFAQWWKGVDK